MINYHVHYSQYEEKFIFNKLNRNGDTFLVLKVEYSLGNIRKFLDFIEDIELEDDSEILCNDVKFVYKNNNKTIIITTDGKNTVLKYNDSFKDAISTAAYFN